MYNVNEQETRKNIKLYLKRCMLRMRPSRGRLQWCDAMQQSRIKVLIIVMRKYAIYTSQTFLLPGPYLVQE